MIWYLKHECTYILAKKGAPVHESIFRRYDIRGIVGKDLEVNEVYMLGRSLAKLFIDLNPQFSSIVLARDGRVHSPQIFEELVNAFLDSGINVFDAGCCPTPAMYFSLFTMPIHGGVMITASHNDARYNGMKICIGKQPLWADSLKLLYSYYLQKKCHQPVIRGVRVSIDVLEKYIKWLTVHFAHLKHMQLPVLVDCANGMAGPVLRELIMRLDWPNVELLNESVDGLFPAHNPDPVELENITLLQQRCEQENKMGVGFDGDADRMIPITETGEQLLGDITLALFAMPLLKERKSRIVFDAKCSHVLSQLIKDLGGTAIMTATGHTNIKTTMQDEYAALGGEMSGHYMFADRYFGYDDGIYSMARLLELVIQENRTLAEIRNLLPRTYATPEFRFSCDAVKADRIIGAVRDTYALRKDIQTRLYEGLRIEADQGWMLIRQSNTQPVLSVRIEANSKDALDALKKECDQLLRPWLPEAIVMKEEV